MDAAQAEMRRFENIEANRHEIMKWMVGIMVAQAALIVAGMLFFR